MNLPKITVVTPSYNQGKFIERTILSVLEQNYPNYEYIIIDGGSTDETINVIKKYENKINYWISEKDSGQTNAINKGMERATGDIVCWINSDDVLLPRALHVVAHYFIEHPSVQFLNGLSLEIDKEDYVLKLTHVLLSKFFAKKGCFNVCQQGMFWKREVFKSIGFLDESFHACMDWEFIIRLYEHDIIMSQINTPLGAIRIHEETKTSIGGEIWTDDWRRLYDRYNGLYLPIKKNNIFFIIYALFKLCRGYYLNDLYFRWKFKNYKFYNV